MAIKKILITSVAVALYLASCDTHDPIYNTVHPEHGRITVTTDWSGLGDGITKPSTYMVEVGAYKGNTNADKHTIPNLFEAGDYTAYLYNDVPEIPVTVSVSGAEARVNSIAAPAVKSGGYLEPLPGWLFAGKLEAAIEKDKHHELTVIMEQLVRELTLVIGFESGVADKVESIAATLSGVAGSFDITNGTHGTPSDVAMNFTKVTQGDYAGKWAAVVRLLGVAGGEQKLTGTIKLAGGDPESMPLESDLTTDLKNFNTDKKTPLLLSGQPTVNPGENPVQPDFTSTITDWISNPGGTIILNDD